MTQGLAPPVEGLITLFSHPVGAKRGWVGVASAAVARGLLLLLLLVRVLFISFCFRVAYVADAY